MTDNGRRYYLSPAILERVKYDEAEARRQALRDRANQVPAELRWDIEESLARRTTMKSIRKSS